MGKSATHSVWYKRSAARRYQQGADVTIEIGKTVNVGDEDEAWRIRPENPSHLVAKLTHLVVAAERAQDQHASRR